ncbi:hypothetical protein HDU97_004002, partial [Phlyctochytrium planicorne]
MRLWTGGLLCLILAATGHTILASSSPSSPSSHSSSSSSSSSKPSSSSSSPASHSTSSSTSHSSNSTIKLSSASDPCTVLSSKPVFSHSDAFACYNSFSLFPEVRTGQVEALKKYLQFYVFNDISKASSDPYFPSNLDLNEKLDAIASDDSIDTEYAFHWKIGNVFRSLLDPHTSYQSSCFSHVHFFQPWVLAGSYSAGSAKPDIYILDKVTSASPKLQELGSELLQQMEKFWKDAGLDISKYAGHKVVKIDGKEAISAIQSKGDLFGVSRVEEARFNLQLASKSFSKGKYQLNDGHFYISKSPDPSSSDSIQYDLVSKDGATTILRVPWVAFVGPAARAAFADRQTFYQKACVNSWSDIQQGIPPKPPKAGSVNFEPHRKPSEFGLKLVSPDEKVEDFFVEDFGHKAASEGHQITLTSLKLKSQLAAARMKAKELNSDPELKPNTINPQVDWTHAAKQSMRLQYDAALKLHGMIRPDGSLEGFNIDKPIVSDDYMAFYM